MSWTPLINADSTLKILFSPGADYFDSHLTECGLPAVMTSKGIVLLYKGKNDTDNGDKSNTTGAYCGAQALFSLTDPTKVIARLNKPFFVPGEPFEKSWQYPQGTVFAEGLMYFHANGFCIIAAPIQG
jgi:predicted GH43/DUF377 family glycosyl hydrolase